jgi:hypothetical protein
VFGLQVFHEIDELGGEFSAGRAPTGAEIKDEKLLVGEVFIGVGLAGGAEQMCPQRIGDARGALAAVERGYLAGALENVGASNVGLIVFGAVRRGESDLLGGDLGHVDLDPGGDFGAVVPAAV